MAEAVVRPIVSERDLSGCQNGRARRNRRRKLAKAKRNLVYRLTICLRRAAEETAQSRARPRRR